MSPSYFIVVNRKQIGPFSLEELKSKPIKRDSLVWTEGLNEWTPLEQIPELAELLKTIPPPIPRKSSVSLQSQSTLPLKRVKFFWLGITCLSLLGNLLCAWLIFNRDGFFQMIRSEKADFQPLVNNNEDGAFSDVSVLERVKRFHLALHSDEIFKNMITSDFNKFVKEFSKPRRMQWLHVKLTQDEVFKGLVPNRFEDAIDWLGLTKAPSPSMKPQN